jgi:diguanylate cyclase (GGDEF)-like protein
MAFAVLIAMLVGIGEAGLRRMKEIEENLGDITGRRSDKLQLSRETLALSNRNSRITMEIFLLQDRAQTNVLLATRAENTKKISALMAEITRRCESAEEKQRLSAVEATRKLYIDSYLRALHLLVDERERDAAAAVMVNETLPALVKLHAAWDEFVDFQKNQVSIATKQAEVDYAKARRLAYLLIVLAVAVALAIALFTTRQTACEIAMRIDAQKEVSKLNGALEEKVMQRTRQLSEAVKQVQFLAYYDALTRLPNRTLLQDRLAKALASARRRKDKVALLFLDLDRFKIINDSLGHSVGDLFLQNVAERLKTWAREQDTVARAGGDEFVIVLTAVKDASDAAVAARRLMDTITAKFVVQGHSIGISCSVGISIFPEHGTDGEALIKNADAAMYCAKESGHNNFRFYTKDMNAQAVERLTLENDLRLALTRNWASCHPISSYALLRTAA